MSSSNPTCLGCRKANRPCIPQLGGRSCVACRNAHKKCSLVPPAASRSHNTASSSQYKTKGHADSFVVSDDEPIPEEPWTPSPRRSRPSPYFRSPSPRPTSPASFNRPVASQFSDKAVYHQALRDWAKRAKVFEPMRNPRFEQPTTSFTHAPASQPATSGFHRTPASDPPPQPPQPRDPSPEVIFIPSRSASPARPFPPPPTASNPHPPISPTASPSPLQNSSPRSSQSGAPSPAAKSQSPDVAPHTPTVCTL